MIILFVVSLLLAAVVIYLKFSQSRTNNEDAETEKETKESAIDVPYFGKSPLTEIEQILYYRLKEALPELNILAQVPLSALIGIRKNKGWQAQFNAINKKSVDYVVCRKDFSVVAVIELDDSTHEKPDRKKSDEIKNIAFKKAGVEILRLKPASLPAVESIATAFKTFEKKTLPSSAT